MNIIEEGKNVLDIELKALEMTKNCLDERFKMIVDEIIQCKGKIVITGMGKPGHIATKISATFASLGTPSFFLHPAEALHGDLGMISKDDIVIAISFSGESDEIVRILPNIKKIGALLIGISGNDKSTLVKMSDISFVFPTIEEACYMKLAPTSSTTVALAFGDALAVTCAKVKEFNKENYALFHPAGSLGKGLLTKVSDLMYKDEENSVININATFGEALNEMCKNTFGIVNIVDDNNKLVGIFTDGDLRRKLFNKTDIYNLELKDIITNNPVVMRKDMLATEALRIMISGDRKISGAPVIDENGILLGTICMKEIVKNGIVI